MKITLLCFRSEEPALTNMDISTGHMVLVSWTHAKPSVLLILAYYILFNMQHVFDTVSNTLYYSIISCPQTWAMCISDVFVSVLHGRSSPQQRTSRAGVGCSLRLRSRTLRDHHSLQSKSPPRHHVISSLTQYTLTCFVI
jgi:hypothetical protein